MRQPTCTPCQRHESIGALGGRAETHVRTSIIPVHEARLGYVQDVAVVRQGPVPLNPLHHQLHVPDATIEVGMEVSRYGGEGYLVYLLDAAVFRVGTVQRVPEYAAGCEEAMCKLVPVRQVVLALGALQRQSLVSVAPHRWLILRGTYRERAQVLCKLQQLQLAAVLGLLPLRGIVGSHGLLRSLLSRCKLVRRGLAWLRRLLLALRLRLGGLLRGLRRVGRLGLRSNGR